MTMHMETPAGGDGGRQNVSFGSQAERLIITKSTPGLQDFRRAFLVRRFGFSPEMAAAVAALAFETREVAQ